MARQEITNPMDDNNLNKFNHNFTELYDGVRDASGNINKLERDLINQINNIKDSISEDAYNKLVEDARLDWREMVDEYSELPNDARKGTTIGVKEQGIIYRYNGSTWDRLFEINLNPISEVDDRLTSQLNEIDTFYAKESMVSRKVRKPIITWVDDDGMEGVYTKLKPLAEEYGITFTSALITKNLENPTDRTLNISQIQELKQLGFEFVSHTHNHDPNKRPTSMSDEEIREDFSESVRLLKKYGLNHRCVVFPFSISGWDQRVGSIAKEYFEYGIGTGATGPSVDDSGYANTPPINQYYIRRTTIERGADVVKRQIDKAVEENGWVVIVSHVDNTGSNDWWDESVARDVIEYALSQGVEFVTTEEGIKRFGNIAQFGDSRPYMDAAHEVRLGGSTIIDSDGKIHSYKLGKYRYLHPNTVDSDTPISEFVANAVTVCDITLNNASDFPRQRSGTLETHRQSEGAFHYQRYITSRDKRYFVRHWDTTNNKWAEWTEENIVQFLETNALTSESNPYSANLQGKITYTYIDSTNTGGFPENRQGWLVNHALYSGSSGTIYQEFHSRQSVRVFRRFFYGDEFGVWHLVQGKIGAFNLGQDAVTSATPPSDFDEGISISYISGAAKDSGLPDNSTGILKTEKVTNQNGRTYQEFKKYNSFDKYIRYANNNNQWSEWKKFLLE